MNDIKISVIIANYNNGKTLERAILSVLSQTHKNYEILLIDGGSTDESLKIIEKYKKEFAFSVSEPDEGLGDAWNKGLEQVSGDIIGLLNADDEYYFRNFEFLAEEYIKYGNCIYYGETYFIENNQVVSVNRKEFSEKNLLWGFGFTHTSCLIPKSVYEEVGRFNTKVKIAVDTDFLIRAYIKGIVFRKINVKVYMSKGGLSDKYFIKAYREYLNLLVDNEVYKKNTVRRQLFKVKMLLPFRYIKNSSKIKNVLRQIKHILVFFINKVYSLMFFKFMRSIYLRFLRIKIGKISSIIPGFKIYRFSNLKIGSNTVINRNSLIDNRAEVFIGNNVSIAHNCSIYTGGHEINSPYFEFVSKKVEIHDYAVLFANVIVNPGIVIGKGAVIMAGSVVTKDVEPFTIVGGNPAEVIGKRKEGLCYNLDYNYWGAL